MHRRILDDPDFVDGPALDAVHGAVRAGVVTHGGRPRHSPLRLLPIYAITDRARLRRRRSRGNRAAPLRRSGSRLVRSARKAMPDRELCCAAVELSAGWRGGSGSAALVNDRVDVARLAGVGRSSGRGRPAGGGRAAASSQDGPRRGLDARSPGGAAAPSEIRPATTSPSARSSRAARSGRGRRGACGALAASPRSGSEAARRDRRDHGGSSLDGVLDAGADSAAMIGGLRRGRRDRRECAAAPSTRARRRRRCTGRIYLVGLHGERQDGHRPPGGGALGRALRGPRRARSSASRASRCARSSKRPASRPSASAKSVFLDGHGVAPARRRRDRRRTASSARKPARDRAPGHGRRPRRAASRSCSARLAGKTDRPLFLGAPSRRPGSTPSASLSIEWGRSRSRSADASVEEAADRVLDALDPEPLEAAP